MKKSVEKRSTKSPPKKKPRLERHHLERFEVPTDADIERMVGVQLGVPTDADIERMVSGLSRDGANPWADVQLSERDAMRFLDAGIPISLAVERRVMSLGVDDEVVLYMSGFPPEQTAKIKLPGLLLPVWGPEGKIRFKQVRPDDPFQHRPKYETPRGARLTLDIQPSVRADVLAEGGRKYVAESVIKGMALAARGLPAIALQGVTGWKRKGKPRSDLDLIPWEGADIEIIFDSDVTTNENVYREARELAEELRRRGARPVIRLLPPHAKDKKQDIDEWLGRDRGERDLLALPILDPDFVHPADPDVRKALRRERITISTRERARLEHAAATFEAVPSTPTLADELLIRETLIPYVVEGWQLAGHNVSLTAEFKVGKTTLLAHVMKCLCDASAFLGVHDVRLAGNVAFWNYELTSQQFRAWLRDLGIVRKQRASILNLRGHRLPLITPTGEDYAVEWLRSRKIKYWIIDTFVRAMADCGLDENSNRDVEVFTRALDIIKERADVPNLILSVHTGRMLHEEGRERARGATRLDDWADARWILTRQSERRFLRADGRDVERPEREVRFDPETRSFELGDGNRQAARLEAGIQRVTQIVAGEPGMGKNDLRRALGMKNDRADEAIRAAEARGEIRIDRSGKSHRHYPGDSDRFRIKVRDDD